MNARRSFRMIEFITPDCKIVQSSSRIRDGDCEKNTEVFSCVWPCTRLASSMKDYDQARAPLKFPTLPLSKWQLKSCPTQKKHFVTSPSSSERSKLFPQEACVNLAPRFPHMRRGTEPNTTYDHIFAHRCKWRSRGRIWHHLMSAAVAIFYLPNPYPNPTSTKMSRFSHNSWSSFFSGVVGQVTCHMKMCAVRSQGALSTPSQEAGIRKWVEMSGADVMTEIYVQATCPRNKCFFGKIKQNTP